MPSTPSKSMIPVVLSKTKHHVFQSSSFPVKIPTLLTMFESMMLTNCVERSDVPLLAPTGMAVA